MRTRTFTANLSSISLYKSGFLALALYSSNLVAEMSPKLLEYLVVLLLCIIFQDFGVKAEEFTINVSNCSSALSSGNSSLLPNCTITSSNEFHIQCTGSHAIKVWIELNVETQIRCTHKNYMSVDAIFQNGTPQPSLRDSYIHQERHAENMSDPSTFTHVVKLNPKDARIVKYSIRDQKARKENEISIMVLYSYWENSWMANNAPETIFEAEQEIILIPCVDSGPHVPAELCIVEGPEDNETLLPIPIDNIKLKYDASKGFYVNTTLFTDYNDHLYRCMEETGNDNGFDFRIQDLPGLKVMPLKQGNEQIRLFATKLVNMAPVHVQCNHKDPVRLEGMITTNKVDHPTWLIDFYTSDELLDWRSRSKEIDISDQVQYKTKNLPKTRHIANYRPITGLKVFDELVINCISVPNGQLLYHWTFVVHDAGSGNTLSGNKYLHLTFPTRKIITEDSLSHEYQCYSETYDDVKLRSIRCSNPHQCALLEDCFNDNYRCGDVVAEASPCPKSQLFPTSSRSCQQSKALLPGQITLCTAGGYKFFQMHFVGFDKIIYNFYQRSGIDPSAIIQIETLEQYEYFYTKGSFKFKCKVHQFFSEGQIYWAILYNNGSEHGKNKFREISRQDATDLVPHSQGSEIVLESSDVDGIVCYAPDISSNSNWFRSTLRIDVKNSILPKILTEQNKRSFDENAENPVIECQADGFPLPTIEWFRFGEKIEDHLRLSDGANNAKILRFDKATTEIQGVYECTASNILGNVTKEFTVSVRKDTKILVAVISVIMGLVVMLVPLLFLYRRYRLSKKPQIKMDETELDEFVNGLPEDQRNPEDPTQLPFKKEYEIAKDDIDIDKTRHLGGGRFGDVFLGKLKGVDVPYAFKMAKPNCPDEIFEALRLELKLMTFLESHVNVVALRGAYISEIQLGVLYIVMEFCEHGSLETFIKKKENYYGMSRPEGQPNGSKYEHMQVLQGPQAFDFHDLLLWSEQIATGMEFLSKQKIVHLDLAARNVLISSDRTAKICDFSLSRRLYEKIIYVKTGNEPVPWRLMAIECLLADTYSTESDVWAYGILLWEIFTLGQEPYPGVRWTNKFEFGNQLRMGLRNLKADYATPEIDEMMRRCWVEEPQNRPGFSELKLFFSKLRNYIRVE